MGWAFVGANKAYETSKSLDISGWERFGWTISGIFAGDYFVVKNNWSEVEKTVTMDGKYNFIFQDNPFYSIWTSSLFASYLKDNYYDNENSRT